jgi:hypothetical protein
MSFDYDTGLGVALLIVLVRDAYLLAMRLSIRYGNMAAIGFRQSFVTGRWKRGGSLLWEIPVSLLFSAVTVALSWVGVLYQVAVISHQAWKSAGAPPEIKGLQWRLRNIRLAPRSVAELQARFIEAAHGREASPEQREKAIARILAVLPDDDPQIVYVPDYDGSLVVPDRSEDGIYHVRGHPVGRGTPPPPTTPAVDDLEEDDEYGMRHVSRGE